jgi:hypothetical protein
VKRKRGHFEREAWIMALLLPAIILIGVVAGMALPWLSKLSEWHPH